MKSWLRLGITASLIGTTLLGSVIGYNLPVLALPIEQVIPRLEPIPVFTVADETGAPLVATGENNLQVAAVFISPSDAQAFLDKLQQQNPDLANQVKVVPVSLSKIYEFSVNNQNNAQALQFQYVPIEAQVTEAQQLMEASGQEFPGGVPLFVATAGAEKGYVTIQRDNEQVIPFFFEKQQLDNMLTSFKEQQPELADQVQIQVIPLETVLFTLQTSEDQELTKIMLIPSVEAMDFVRSNTNTAPANNPTANPAPTDAQP